jgi:hypothetical protein
MLYAESNSKKRLPGSVRDRSLGHSRPRLILLVGEQPSRPHPSPVPRVEPQVDRLKRCSGPCKQWLPVECFRRTPKSPDGHERECKACRSERTRELEAGASKCRPWQRKKLAKCESSAR